MTNIIFFNKDNALNLAFSLVAREENLKLKAYLDSKNIPTIGYGSTFVDGKKVTLGMTCSKEQAKTWFLQTLSQVCDELYSFCNDNNIYLEDNQAATIISFIYNAGFNAFIHSSMAHDLIVGELDKVTSDLMKWDKIRIDGNLEFSVGLFNRRMEESQCFIDESRC